MSKKHFLALSLLITATQVQAGDLPKTISPTLSERAQDLAQADVWKPVNIAQKDIFYFTDAEGFQPKYRFNETIRCTFMEPEETGPLKGLTPKFHCRTAEGDDLKVKYGPYNKMNNQEVFAETIGTRLLWALGFGADAIYSVRVECANCPKEPYDWMNSRNMAVTHGTRDWLHDISVRGDQVFSAAIVEKKFKGIKIEQFADQGWGWDELFNMAGVDATKRMHRQALGLLMGMLAHWDSKAENQRLVCLKDGIVNNQGKFQCTKPFAIVQDLGQTFGDTFPTGMNREAWSKSRTWQDKSRCIVNGHEPSGILAPRFRGPLKNFQVTESARVFLVNLLKQLSRYQIEQLFVISQISDMEGKWSSEERAASTAAWADVFQAKIEDIASARCPN